MPVSTGAATAAIASQTIPERAGYTAKSL